MRRVLLITFCYPPSEIIGAVRPAGLAKYLPNYGWTPVILTPRVHQARHDSKVIETGYRDLVASWKTRLGLDGHRSMHEQLGLAVSPRQGSGRVYTRALQLAKYFLAFPDETKGWVPFAQEAIAKLGSRGPKIDAIISTSPPISAHLVARRAKEVLGCPWVADLRDLWTQNLTSRFSLLQPLARILESRTLGQADLLVTVSDQWNERLKSRYAHKSICTIANGFDPDEFAPRRVPLTSRFSITYTGMLYEGRRDPSPVLESIHQLIFEGAMSRDQIALRFLGPMEPWLTAVIARYGLQDITECPGLLPRHLALERQQESQILLQLGWGDPRETGQHTGKLFEYLGSRRPILAVGGVPGALTDVLKETGAGVHVQSREELRQYLLSAYQEFQQHGSVRYDGNETAISRYSHREMARKFASVLSQATGLDTGETPDQQDCTQTSLSVF